MASTLWLARIRFAGAGLLALSVLGLTGCGLPEARRALGCEHAYDPKLASLCARIVPELHLDTVWTGRCGLPSFHWAYVCDAETVAELICSGAFSQADAELASEAATAEIDPDSYRCLNRLSAAYTAHAKGETPSYLDPGLREVERQCPAKHGARAEATD